MAASVLATLPVRGLLVHGPHPHEHLSAAACIKKYAVAQFREDVQLLPFFRTIPEADRTFVELGALDGWHGSNTLMLERCFGWTGLLIEASPHNFRNLQRSGRRAQLAHSAVCRGNGTVTLMEGAHLSTQVDRSDPAYNGQYFDYVHKFGFDGEQNLTRTVTVPCRSLTELMQGAGLPRAAFLSLDVQGAEEQVIRSVDPRAFQLICVEVDDWRPEEAAKNRRVEERILASGMVRANSTLDVIYLSKVFVRPETGWGAKGGSSRVRARTFNRG